MSANTRGHCELQQATTFGSESFRSRSVDPTSIRRSARRGSPRAPDSHAAANSASRQPPSAAPSPARSPPAVNRSRRPQMVNLQSESTTVAGRLEHLTVCSLTILCSLLVHVRKQGENRDEYSIYQSCRQCDRVGKRAQLASCLSRG